MLPRRSPPQWPWVDQLNAYIIRALCRGILLPRAPGRPADGGLDELERLKVDEAPRAAHDAALGEGRDEVPRPEKSSMPHRAVPMPGSTCESLPAAAGMR